MKNLESPKFEMDKPMLAIANALYESLQREESLKASIAEFEHQKSEVTNVHSDMLTRNSELRTTVDELLAKNDDICAVMLYLSERLDAHGETFDEEKYNGVLKKAREQRAALTIKSDIKLAPLSTEDRQKIQSCPSVLSVESKWNNTRLEIELYTALNAERDRLKNLRITWEVADVLNIVRPFIEAIDRIGRLEELYDLSRKSYEVTKNPYFEGAMDVLDSALRHPKATVAKSETVQAGDA